LFIDWYALFCSDLLSAKLPSVPEECIPDDMFRGRSVGGPGYAELDLLALQQATVLPAQVSQPQPIVQQHLQQPPPGSPLQYTATIFAQPETDSNFRPSGPSAFQQGTFVIQMTETYLHPLT